MPEHYSLLTYQHADKSIYAVKSRLYGQDKSLFNIGDYIQSLAANSIFHMFLIILIEMVLLMKI